MSCSLGTSCHRVIFPTYTHTLSLPYDLLHIIPLTTLLLYCMLGYRRIYELGSISSTWLFLSLITLNLLLNGKLIQLIYKGNELITLQAKDVGSLLFKFAFINMTIPWPSSNTLVTAEIPLVSFTLIYTSWFWILYTSLCCISPRSSS